MIDLQPSTSPSGPMSSEDKAKVRKQLERLLQTHHFNNSRRYPALLRFIVEETLEGRGEFLKERLLGVRVFDRPADYDTAADPIVRVTIAEIRKRIAQYYHDEEHDAEMRIELLPGRYAPEFRTRPEKREGSGAVEAEAAAMTPAAAVVLEQEGASAAGQVKSRRSKWIYAGVVAAVLLVSVVGVAMERWFDQSALDALWSPLLKSARPVLFCIPTGAGKTAGPIELTGNFDTFAGRKSKAPGPSEPTFLDYESLGQNIVYSDMLAVLKISNVMAGYHRDYRVRLNVSTNLEDLRQGPTVLIGGLDNQWTLRALAPLRFHFAGSDEDRYWIADSQNPGSKSWSLDLKQQFKTVTRDYAIIARLHNEETGQTEMIVAGIGMSGTAAAGEFLGDKTRIEELQQRVGRGFKDHDFEAVLSTEVVNGIAGSPRIVAVAVW